MISKTPSLNVYSELNPWIDYLFTFNSEPEIIKAEEILEKGFDNWFREHESSETLAEYLVECLNENGIDHEIYYKNEEDK